MLTILVIEDEQLVSDYIETCLQRCGYKTVAAQSGEIAIHLAEQSPPDLALVDIRLPGKLDGVETAVRLDERFNVGSVFLTAYSDSATIARAAQARPLGYLLKPFRDRDLLVAVEMAAHQRAKGRPKDHKLLALDYLQELTLRRDRLEDVIVTLRKLSLNENSDQGKLPKRGRPPGKSKPRPITWTGP